MESVAARPVSPYPPLLRRVDVAAVRIWLVAGGLVTYLAIDGGGYDIVVHSQAAIVVWWTVLIGAALGVLPAARLTRWAWVALALFGGFVVWTALASTWSASSERSLQALSLDLGYLGVLILAIGVHRDREHAMRHTIAAVASAIVIVAVLALATRLHPGLVADASLSGTFLPGASARLSWPLNYWNALAALLAFGLPLLLTLANSARWIIAQAAAAAAIPIIAVTAYLTFSRGGLIAFAVAVVVYFALAPDRIPKLLTGLIAGAASAALIAGCVHRSAVGKGLLTATARHEGSTLILPIILACAGVALCQVGIGLATRHGRRPRVLVISRKQALIGLAVGVVVVVAVALAAGAPHRLSHAWQDFKHPTAPGLQTDALSRFGKLSGNGRYDFWKVAVDSTSGHLLTGNGPGTYQFLWLQKAPYYSYLINAHSLYFESLAEEGLVGLALIVGFIVLIIARGARLVFLTREATRTRAAGITAAVVAFAVSAGADWTWQVPVVPTAFFLIAATVLVPSRRARRQEADRAAAGAGWRPIAVRVGLIVLALASVVAIGVPLATTNAVRRSQAAVNAGNLPQALNDAVSAIRIEPGAASAQTQLALVLEAQGHTRQALTSAHKAVKDEPDSWSAWLILSRLEAETRHPGASLAAYRRARVLNPRSPVFVASTGLPK